MQTIWHVEWYCFSPKATLVACTKIWIAICGPAGKFGNTKISFVQPSHQPALLGSPANSCFQFYTPSSSHIALQDPTDERWTSNCQILARKKPSDLISWWSVSWRVSKTTKNHYQPYCSFLVHILQFCAQCLAALLPLEQIWIVWNEDLCQGCSIGMMPSLIWSFSSTRIYRTFWILCIVRVWIFLPRQKPTQQYHIPLLY